MKTTIISIAIFLITITTNILSVSSQTFSDHFFDRKYENGKVVSSTRYESGYLGLYEKTFMYSYSYNESGSMDKKEAFKWNKKENTWTPVYSIDYTYDILNNYTMEYSVWNKKENKFNPVSEKALYQFDDNGNIVSSIFIKNNLTKFEDLTLNQDSGVQYFAM